MVLLDKINDGLSLFAIITFHASILAAIVMLGILAHDHTTTQVGLIVPMTPEGAVLYAEAYDYPPPCFDGPAALYKTYETYMVEDPNEALSAPVTCFAQVLVER